ncbi:MAG: ORF6N domain-containing protein, partial [bacterium]|nr:ORF6N domain-containing protein [bacterium]
MILLVTYQEKKIKSKINPQQFSVYQLKKSCLLDLRRPPCTAWIYCRTIYGVAKKALNQSIKRNKERFPKDFVFQLNQEEKIELVTNCDHLSRLKYSSSLPYAFTEH